MGRWRRWAVVGLAVGLALAGGVGVTSQNAVAQDGADPTRELSATDQRYVDDFGAALTRFRGLSLEEFYGEFGPQKSYLVHHPDGFLRGDAGDDGSVDLSDAICILVYLFGGGGACGNASCADALDVDDSGSVDITDAVGLLGFLFQGGEPPRAPYPESGLDPTEDALPCPVARRLSYEPVEAEQLDEIFSFFLPSIEQEELFRRNGFVIYDNVKFDSMLRGYFEIWRRHLPVYISVDSILDALHLSFDRLLMALEERTLYGELDSMLVEMESDIDTLGDYAGERTIDAELDDVATWVCVARSLLAGDKVACARGVDDQVSSTLSLIDAQKQVKVFLLGALRVVDFSQYRVRGHYTRSVTLERYFRAMMWVQRIGLSFAKDPRDARLAYLLTTLLEDSGALERWEQVNSAVSAMVGVSDSLNPVGMSSLVAGGGFALGDLYSDTRFHEFQRVAFETGAGHQKINSELIRFNPFAIEGFTAFPRLFHVMGQRFVVDSYVFQNVTFDRIPKLANRYMPSPLDAWFVLGNRATLPLLRPELETWGYQSNLAALDYIVSSYEYRGFWDSSLYNVWLSALRSLNADTTSDRYPEVMRTETWDRRILGAQLASWAHLRRDFILYAKPSFPPGGCYYPHGWVDPYPEFYDTLAAFGGRAREIFAQLGSEGAVTQYFDELEYVAGELAGIARTELAEEELSEEQTVFIRSWLTQRTLGCGVGPEEEIDRTEPMVFDGWYPRIVFLDPANGEWGEGGDWAFNNGEGFDPTIADIHTTPPIAGSEVLHVGVGYPRLMLTSIKNGCGTRAYVGPVLSYHEFVAGDMKRWTDEEWKEELESGWRPPRPDWMREFIR